MPQTKTALLLLLIVATLASCSNGATNDNTAANNTVKESTVPPPPPQEAAPLASVETETYSLKLHRAIGFLPQSDPMGMFKVMEGHQFVALDIAVTNKTGKPLDMAQIFRGIQVTDDKGQKIKNSVTAVASYTNDHPEEDKQAEYNAIRSKEMETGVTHRAFVYGLEAPMETKNFTLTIPEAPGVKAKKEIQFSL